ncbi:hypothetical protein [Deinococcus murrayi]|uniref:hypothetical protein n=1 Tax=Deinococcus murrayi TaxID=68910 RepID=UPI000ACE061C|nr:hypothetical protein [Deinococcus murrayi]
MTRPPASTDRPPAQEAAPEEHAPGTAPIGTLMVVAVLVLTMIWLWMLVLGVQQGRS